MRIAISGSSGFVGSALATHWRSAGHDVVPLVRGDGRHSRPGTIAWEPASGALDQAAAGALDAVVHLAGETVAQRWTRAKRAAIAQSRGQVTAALCRTLADLPQRPKVLLSASAIGIYGDRGDEELDERSAPGQGFLAEVAREWEAATAPAVQAGIRVAMPRIGVVLDRDGGALARMLFPFRIGLGGPLGSGRQWLSWITRDDLVRAFDFALHTAALHGPFVATAPAPVRQRDFARALGRALHRPALLPTPGWLLRLGFGEMATALLLGSLRTQPSRLLELGFRFAQAQLDVALSHVLRPATVP
jgi:uncharacterized protein (TIGR01777 family)